MTLPEFFSLYPSIAIAFSGGVDSAYLLYAAKKHAKNMQAYYVKSEFQPQFEWEDALKLAKELKVEMKVLSLPVLSLPSVRKNPTDRCYFCKKAIFGAVKEAAKEDGFFVLLDGTNASDDAGDRPGMRALSELSVLSPLRECGLSKDEIRRLSKEAGLFTWKKPSYACLATRIPAGEEITAEKLTAVEAAEADLFSLGFTDFRVRSVNGHARLQLPEAQFEALLKQRKAVLEKLKKYFQSVSLDLEVR